MKLRIVFFLLNLSMLFSLSSTACPSCYGAAQNNTMDATNKAVLTLLGITGFVLTGFVIFAYFMWKRIKKNKELLSTNSFVDEQGNIHIENKGSYEWNIS